MTGRGNAVLAGLILLLLCNCTSVKKDSESAASGALNKITNIEISGFNIKVEAVEPFNYEILHSDSRLTHGVFLQGVSAEGFDGKTLSSGQGTPAVVIAVSGTADNVTVSESSNLEITSDSAFTIEPLQEGNILKMKLLRAEESMKTIDSGTMGKFITGIEFKQTDDTSVVEIAGDGPLVPDVFSLEGRIVVDIPSVQLFPMAQVRVQSPLTGIRWGQHKDKVRIVLDLADKVKYDVQLHNKGLSVRLSAQSKMEDIRSTKKLTDDLLQKSTPETAVAKAPDFKDHLISLDFKDADVVSIIRLISEVSGANIVLDPGVAGKITIKLKDMSWQKALDLILRTHNLEKTVIDNTIRIYNPQSNKAATDTEETTGRQIVIKDLNITLTGLNGSVKTIRKANITSENGKLRLDLNVTVDSAKHPVKAKTTRKPLKKHKKKGSRL
ncbi:MAG: AMIN domain-containing protein [Nitrospirae bacterium YQR-1]